MRNGVPGAGTFRDIFRITAVIDVIYGLGFLLVPAILFGMSQDPGVPANPGWVRWAGGLLVGIAVGEWLAAKDPAKQRPMVTFLVLGHGLTALALIYSALSGEYQGVAWFIWSSVIVTGVIAVIMFWLLGKYRPVL